MKFKYIYILNIFKKIDKYNVFVIVFLFKIYLLKNVSRIFRL